MYERENIEVYAAIVSAGLITSVLLLLQHIWSLLQLALWLSHALPSHSYLRSACIAIYIKLFLIRNTGILFIAQTKAALSLAIMGDYILPLETG